MPLSLTALFTGRTPIKRVFIDQAQVWVKTDQSCPQSSAKSTESIKENAASVKLSSDSYNAAPRDINRLDINRLKISVSGYSQYTTELQRLSVTDNNNEIELKARTLIKDAELGAEFSTFANLNLLYKERPQGQVQGHIYGSWREGHYSLIANYNLEDRQLNIESDLKHIPASGVLSLFKKYDLLKRDLQARQIWISFKAKGRGSVDQIQNWPFEVRDVHLEGAVGQMNVESIQFSSLSPLRYSPIRIEVQKLDISRLLQIVEEPVTTPILRELGYFDGVIDVFSPEHLVLKGVANGLELVFSNKGQRQFQALDGISGQAEFQNDRWKIDIVNMTPRNGSFKGQLLFEADKDFVQVDMKTNVQELSLASTIQNLMTGHERIGTLNMAAQGQLRQGRLVEFKGKAFMPFLDVEGIRLQNIDFNFGSQQGNLVIEPKIKNMNFSPQSVLTSRVQKMLALQNQELNFANVGGKFVSGKGLEWKDIRLDFGKTQIATQGAWDEKGFLRGSIKMSEGKSTLKSFKVSGHRDDPQVELIP